MRGSGAFSIVEVLVAIVVFSIGVLGLVSTAAWSEQTIRAGRRFTEVGALAEQVLAAFQATGCGEPGQETRVHGAFELQWSLGAPSAGYQIATLVVSTRHRRLRADTFSATVRC